MTDQVAYEPGWYIVQAFRWDKECRVWRFSKTAYDNTPRWNGGSIHPYWIGPKIELPPVKELEP